jgi:hypothetical protein
VPRKPRLVGGVKGHNQGFAQLEHPNWKIGWNSGPMEYWISKTKKRNFWFGSALLEDHFAEAQGKTKYSWP